MPELRIKEFRMPELHLPEMSRDDISRAIGDATRDVDLSRFDPRRVDLPEVAGDISRELSKIDVPKAIAEARGKTRSRWPFVAIGAFILGLMAIAVRPRRASGPSSSRPPAKRSVASTRCGPSARSGIRRRTPSTARWPSPSSRRRSPARRRRPAPRSMAPASCPDGFGADVASETPAEDLVPRA